MITKRYRVGEIELAYADEGQGVPLVLIHGHPLSHATWDEQAAILRDECRVIRPDLRGLGASSVPPGPYPMELLASDLAALLDVLGIERATVVGHSLGGYVALAFYRRFGARVRGLGLVSSRVQGDTPEVARMRLEMAERMEHEGMGPFAEFALPLFFGERIYDERPDIVRRVRDIVMACNPRGAAEMYRGIAARASSEDLLAQLNIPFLVATGTADALIPPALQKYAADAVPRARYVELTGCGHFPLYERPIETTRALRDLIAYS
ncbi:MAG TPA: alpha/beta hydrolase [Candidatus Binatia bacterium]|nr:alpha/beta hydrolase [Candidatus Binatia bacterium]